MKISTRAALRSGLILPGLGQIYTGSRKKGYAVAAAISLMVLLLGVRLFRLVYGILIGEHGPEGMIFRLNEDTLSAIHSMAYSKNLWLVALIIGLWIYSIIDAWLLGRKWDRYYESAAGAQEKNQGASSGGRSR